MKSALLIPLFLVLISVPAFGQLSDKTGLVNRFDVETDGHSFEIETISNFDVVDHEFDDNEKRLTIFLQSGLEKNLGELIIPKTLLSGNLTFYLDEQEHNPDIKSNDKISFVTLNFTGIGNHKIDIIATNDLAGTDASKIITIDKPLPEGGGCLIATAAYGTELSSQVQHLREIRDQKLMKTETGKLFITSFNTFYYSFSPVVADYERQNPVFKESVKLLLTPMISSLSILNHAQLEDDVQVLGLGVSIIALNVGLYFVAPAILFQRLRK